MFAVWAAVTLSKMPAVGIMLAPTFLMELAVAISFLIRDEPKAATKSLRARLSAYGGSFFAIAFLQIAQRSHPEWFVPQYHAIHAHGHRHVAGRFAVDRSSRSGICAMRSASSPPRAGW